MTHCCLAAEFAWRANTGSILTICCQAMLGTAAILFGCADASLLKSPDITSTVCSPLSASLVAHRSASGPVCSSLGTREPTRVLPTARMPSRIADSCWSSWPLVRTVSSNDASVADWNVSLRGSSSDTASGKQIAPAVLTTTDKPCSSCVAEGHAVLLLRCYTCSNLLVLHGLEQLTGRQQDAASSY